MTNTATKCGYVALIGAPNAGKSTLLNALVGEKLAIVTPKVQTTRTQLRGVLTVDSDQLIFIDTPGLFEAKTPFERMMIGQATMGIEEADYCLLLIDASKKSGLKEAQSLLNRLKGILSRKRLAVVLTKVDRVRKNDLLPMIASLSAMHPFEHVFLTSATKQDGIADMVKTLRDVMPHAPHMFEPDDVCDQSTKLTIAEFVREQVFLNLHDEIPYGIAVQTHAIEPREDGSLNAEIDILVADERHKGMVIGKGGQTLERIGSAARAALQDALQIRLHTYITVKAHKGWAFDRDVLAAIGIMPE